MSLATDNPEAELNRIAEKIIALADAHKHKGERRPYLVSALGIDLGDDLKTIKQLTNKGLNDFIQSRLSDHLTLVRLGAHRNVAAVIDRAADSAEFELLPGVERRASPRFNYRFWAAFSVPPKSEIRVLDPDEFTFEDVAASDVREDALTIANELIVPADADQRDEKIKANIASWLDQNGLPEERFIAPKRLLKNHVVATSSGSLLEAVISALDRRQLQSTSLSLDIVATLLKTPRS